MEKERTRFSTKSKAMFWFNLNNKLVLLLCAFLQLCGVLRMSQSFPPKKNSKVIFCFSWKTQFSANRRLIILMFSFWKIKIDVWYQKWTITERRKHLKLSV